MMASGHDLDDRPREVTYVIGGAAVGKSTWIRQNLSMTHIIIDPDTLKELCPLQDENPDAKGSPTYVWTKMRASELMENALVEPGRYVIVGTGGSTGSKEGGSSSKKVEFLQRAREAGYTTRVVLLHCPTEVALERNSSRPKGLSKDIVLESLQTAHAAFLTLRNVCDEAEKIDTSTNNKDAHGRRQSFAQLKAYAKLGTVGTMNVDRRRGSLMATG